jgi:hypothetical protein
MRWIKWRTRTTIREFALVLVHRADELTCLISTDPVSTRVMKMIEDYVRLPWSNEETGLRLFTVYIRKDLVQDEAPLGSRL